MIIIHIPIPVWPTLLWMVMGLTALKIEEVVEDEDCEFDNEEDFIKLLFSLLLGPLSIILVCIHYEIIDKIRDWLESKLEWFYKIREKKEREKMKFEENKKEQAKPSMFDW